jgi:hypothetical protein
VVGTVVRVLFALLGALTIYVVGAAVLRKFKVPPEEPPEPGELHRIDLRFRCTVCGAEVTMTAAPGDDPEPPRHCREDMVLVGEGSSPA